MHFEKTPTVKTPEHQWFWRPSWASPESERGGGVVEPMHELVNHQLTAHSVPKGG